LQLPDANALIKSGIIAPNKPTKKVRQKKGPSSSSSSAINNDVSSSRVPVSDGGAMAAARFSNSSVVLPTMEVATRVATMSGGAAAHAAKNTTATMEEEVSSRITASDDDTAMATRSVNTAPMMDVVISRITASDGAVAPSHFSSNSSVSMMELSSRNAESDSAKIATQSASTSSAANASHIAMIIVGEEDTLMRETLFTAKLHTAETGIEAAGVGGLHNTTTVVVVDGATSFEVQPTKVPASIATSTTTTTSSCSAVKHVPDTSPPTSQIVIDEADLARLDVGSRNLHLKIVTIISQESQTKLKDYVGRLDREFSTHGTFYFNGLAKLALYLYKLDIPMLMTEEVDAIRSEDISVQNYKKLITAAQKKSVSVKFVQQFCSLLVSKFFTDKNA